MKDHKQELNLPYFEFKIDDREDGEYILDENRKKYVKLTPEEWVRQNFVLYLTRAMNYPRGLMKIEHVIKVGQVTKRCDIVFFKKSLEVFMIVECKAASVKINSDTIRQAAIYNSALGADYLVLTNGLEHFCLGYNKQSGVFEPVGDLPEYPR